MDEDEQSQVNDDSAASVDEGDETEEQSQDDSLDVVLGETDDQSQNDDQESQDNDVRIRRVRLGRVRLLDSEDAFRASFQRFQDDDLNGFSELKLSRLGQEATVNEVYGDRTVTCVFDDGASMDFPWETVAEQISIT